MRMIKSVTAVKRGYGSAPHRSVSFLTDREREAVKRGEIVYFEINKTHYTQSGYKIVIYNCGRYDSREPTTEELFEINMMECRLAGQKDCSRCYYRFKCFTVK